MAKVTMADVAAEAQVNKATVSRALKGDPRISASTREKVWQAAKKLGYRLDTVARGLSSKNTGVIGVVMNDLSLPWVGSFLSGTERVLSRYRIELILKEANGVDTSSFSVLNSLVARKVDGIIWFSEEAIPKVNSSTSMIVKVGSFEEGYPALLLDKEGLKKKIERFLSGRSFSYRKGSRHFYPFLSDLSQESGEVSLLDGLIPSRSDLLDDGSIIICGDMEAARALGLCCIDWPSFEMGGLAARILVNMVKSRGVRPNKVLVSPSIYGTDGEPLFY